TRAGASVEGIKAAIRRRLKGAGLVGAPGDRTRGFEQTFAALASLGSLAGIVSLFVALFVVYNSMSMSFAERRRETSMAMALGAGRRQVFRALLAEAALLGTLASFGGAVAGIVLAKLLVGRALAAYRVFPITAGGSVHIDPVLILIAVVGGITLLLPSIVSVATRAIRPLMMRFGTLGRLAADGQERNPGRTVLTVGALLVTSALVIGVGAALGSYNHRFSTLAYDWFGAPLY